MEISKELQYFIEGSNSILASLTSPTVPDWSKINDTNQPAHWSEKDTGYKFVDEKDLSTPVKVGDQFFVTHTVYPAARLDGNVLVRFKDAKVIVLRVIDEDQFFITGLSRWAYIQKAKAALGEDCVKVQITATYECVHTSSYISNSYKTVGEIIIKKIKI